MLDDCVARTSALSLSCSRTVPRRGNALSLPADFPLKRRHDGGHRHPFRARVAKRFRSNERPGGTYNLIFIRAEALRGSSTASGVHPVFGNRLRQRKPEQSAPCTSFAAQRGARLPRLCRNCKDSRFGCATRWTGHIRTTPTSNRHQRRKLADDEAIARQQQHRIR